MSAGSHNIKLRQLALVSVMGMWLAGCSSDNTRAPINSVGSQRPTGGMLSPQPSVTSSQIQPIQPVYQSPHVEPSAPVSTPQIPATKPRAHRAQPPAQPVQMRDGKIVYNRQYGAIPKGSYDGGSTYTVKHGDTLFYIAWITGNDFRDLAQRNNVAAPYGLTVGQKLKVSNATGTPITGGNAITVADAQDQGVAPSTGTVTAQNSGRPVASQPTIQYSDDSGEQSANKMLPGGSGSATSVTRPVTTSTTIASTNVPSASSTSDSSPIATWRWPTSGNIIENFSASEGGNKGIDIAGSKGQAVIATADGRVVYAGNALRGYGNLIIIKHNDDYLSAYAHNDTMLVQEQQEVKAGQKIATMGSTGTSSTRLHFEIRYKGKSVNPLRYLPQR